MESTSNENALQKLPTIDELYANKELVKKQTALQVILNQPPAPKWIKENNGVKYLPISVIEFILTSIFRKWWVEVRNVQLIANSVVTTVRLYVVDPITNETMFNDGVGAAPINTKKDAGAVEFDKILSNSVQLATPSSESYAIKDAAGKFGKIFGSDISRKEGFTINPAETLEKKFRLLED